MSENKKHKPGTFCWIELMTTDTGAAKKFYGEIMGWMFEDEQMSHGETYTFLQKREGNIGGMYQQTKEKKGMPSHWMPYISVENTDKIVAQAKTLGATICAEPFDVMDAGRMAVLQDPTGATFSIWQPKASPGTTVDPSVPGNYCWTELGTTDLTKAKTFYSKLFGWTTKKSDNSPMEYTEFLVGKDSIGGMYQLTAEMKGIPAHWLIYFGTDDVDKHANQVKKLGGKIKMEPKNIENVGRFTVFSDPQGATAALFTPEQ